MTARREPDFEIPELRELFATILEFTQERFDLLMHDLMGPNVAPLGESFATMVTRIRAFPSVPTLMCLNMVNGGALVIMKGGPYLEVSELGEPLTAGRFLAKLWSQYLSHDSTSPSQGGLTHKGFRARMGPDVYLQMGLLVKHLGASRHATLILLSRPGKALTGLVVTFLRQFRLLPVTQVAFVGIVGVRHHRYSPTGFRLDLNCSHQGIHVGAEVGLPGSPGGLRRLQRHIVEHVRIILYGFGLGLDHGVAVHLDRCARDLPDLWDGVVHGIRRR